MNFNFYLLQKTWREYSSVVPRPDDDTPRKSLIQAWRDYSSIIEDNWCAVMQDFSHPSAFEFLSEFLQKWKVLRRAWLEEGGFLITTRGTRRDRHIKDIAPPELTALRNELESAMYCYNDISLPSERARIDTLLLIASGALFCPANNSRKRSIKRLRSTYDELKLACLPFPRHILQLPWSRKLR